MGRKFEKITSTWRGIKRRGEKEAWILRKKKREWIERLIRLR